MPVLGVTGGVATGKTTATELLVRHLSETSKVESFSADAAVRRLLDGDPVVAEQIRATFGAGMIAPDGRVDREKLRELVFVDEACRRALEGILHPLVRDEWSRRSKEFRNSGDYFVAEIPLLYETQGDSWCDCVIVVAASDDRRIRRLSGNRGWSSETARRVIDSQMPQDAKIQRADIVIWNDHTKAVLESQVILAVERLKLRYA
ncbi:MAG TPA: dephospho-CoA kinase [Chthoniobacterales bacterium]